MARSTVDKGRVRRLAAGLRAGDGELLARAIELCGSDPGFKGLLEHTFVGTYNHGGLDRLRPLIRKLSEAELLWLCENHADLTRDRTSRLGPSA